MGTRLTLKNNTHSDSNAIFCVRIVVYGLWWENEEEDTDEEFNSEQKTRTHTLKSKLDVVYKRYA